MSATKLLTCIPFKDWSISPSKTILSCGLYFVQKLRSNPFQCALFHFEMISLWRYSSNTTQVGNVMVRLICMPPNHLRSSPTPSTYTPVSLRCTLCKLTQPHHSCGQTKLASMSNFPGLSPYVSGHCLFVFFSICRICLMHFH